MTLLQTTPRVASFISTTLLASFTSSRSNSVTDSGTWAPSTASLSRSVSRDGAPMCRFGNNASVGLVEFPLLNGTQVQKASASTVVLLQPEVDDALLSHTPGDIRCHSVPRQELLRQPALGAALAFAPALGALPGCCNITNVTTGGQLLTGQSVSLTYSRIGTPFEGILSSSMLLVIAPPPNGWVENTALLLDATIRITVLIECGPDTHLSVLSVPAPGVVRALAGQVESAVKYSQMASLATVGATSASSLGRLMAVRSMVLCDADSVVGGGVVDLGLTMCEADGALVAARSAVVSNVVLIAAVAALLLALAATWSLATHAPPRESLLVLCVPSSLLPAWTAVVPSTFAAAALLFGRLWSSPCAGTDAVLALVGAVVALCPFAALVAFWRACASGATPALVCTMMTERREKLGKVDDALHACRWPPPRFTRVLERRWRWRSNPSITGAAIPAGTMRCAWLVLLEYRVLWYAALDSLTLAVIACVAVVSGLGGVSLCRAWSVVAVLLMSVQLVVVVILQPFTTLFACVHAATTLGLTCVGVLAQLVYVFVGSDTSTSGLWLVEASGVCSLAVVGVSAVKSLLDVVTLLRAVQRRVEKRGRTLPRTAREAVINEGADDVSRDWDQELLRSSPPAVLPWSVGNNTNDDHIDDDKVTALQFWDKDGNARQGSKVQDNVVSDAPIGGYFLL